MQNTIKEALPQGTLLKGKYTYYIEAPLGQGSFGITYRAKVILDGEYGSLETLERVAIKEFFMKDLNGRRESTLSTGNDSALFSHYLEKFRKEVVNLSNLKHPGIVKVIEAFSANSTSYYVMQYISGVTLDDEIKRKGKMDFKSAYPLLEEICAALSYMHENNMLHLDLKPSNIMLSEDNLPILIDFGLSKHYNEQGAVETTTTIGLGTPGYAPIEQNGLFNKDNLNVTMDIYALGATLFKMLTGTTPPPAAEIINDRNKLITHLVSADVHECVINLIQHAMHPLKAERIQNVNILKCELEKCIQIILQQKTEHTSQSADVKPSENLLPETESEETIIATNSETKEESILKEENDNNTEDVEIGEKQSIARRIFKGTLYVVLFMFVYLLMMYGYLFVRYDNFNQYEFFYITVTNNQKKGVCNFWGFEIIDTEYDDVDYIGQGLFRVKQNKKYGIVTSHNDAVTGIIYDDITSFITEKLIEVEMNGKSGYIDTDGKTVIPLIYESIFYYSEGLSKAKKDGKWGYLNSSGEIIVPFIYDDATSFWNGFAAVKLNGKWGCIDKTGNLIVQPIYDDIDDTTSKHIKVRQGDKYGFINSDWEEITPIIYDEIGGVNTQYASVKRNKKWGRLDLSTGKEIVVPIYEKLGHFNIVGEKTLALVKRDGKYGYIDNNWKEVLEPVYDEILSWKWNIYHVRIGNKHGLIDNNFNEVLPIIYDNISHYLTNDKLIKIELNSQYGLIDKTGNVVIKPMYDELDVNDDGTIKAKLEEKYGFLDHTGKTIVPFIFDAAMYFSEGTANVKKANKWGVINTKGEIIMDFKNDSITRMKNGYAFILRADKWVRIDVKGTEFLNPWYDCLEITNDIIKFKQEGKWGCMDTNLNILVNPKYDELRYFDSIYFMAQHNGKWGIVDNKLQELVPPIYDEIINDYSGDDVTRIRLGNKWGLMNESFYKVVEPEFDTIIRTHKYYILRNPSYSYLYHIERKEIIKEPNEIREIMGLNKKKKESIH